MLTPDPSTGGDEHRGRHPQDLVVADGPDVEGRAGRVGDLELPQQRPRVVTRTQVDERTDIDADQGKLAVGLLVEPLKIGHLCAAGRAQSCPKIQNHWLALLLPEVRQRDLLPADFRLALVHADLNIRCEPQRRGRSRIRWRLDCAGTEQGETYGCCKCDNHRHADDRRFCAHGFPSRTSQNEYTAQLHHKREILRSGLAYIGLVGGEGRCRSR